MLKGCNAACGLRKNRQSIIFFLYPKKIKQTKFDQIISYLLALVTILIGHERGQTYCECTTAAYIYKTINEIEQSSTTMGIICSMASNASISK